MAELFSPRTLVIVQVVFGPTLSGLKGFRLSDVDELIEGDFGKKNAYKTLERLAKLGWLEITIDRDDQTGGRPAMRLYTRTRKGDHEYQKLTAMLTKYGITLEQKR